jgi:hypothetical protein
MSGYLAKLENHPDLEGDIIKATKIHKVLRAMIKLASIPKDEVHNFKKRSTELLQKWNKTLADDPSGAEKDDEKTDEKAEEGSKTEGNGEKHAAEGGEAPKATDKEANSSNGESKQEVNANKDDANTAEETTSKEAEKAADDSTAASN